ncbi:MAG: septum formation inhibitor Maf [Gammaproteobacteria bacterium]|nr:septum formation inhibitor Maf [Gammaproteobacteria bacterium]NNL06820.1 septum formation inhibitor Maf [Gammaproteobacteria bacterium]
MARKLVLASSSPRRSELLEQIGLSFKVHAVDMDESMLPGEAVLEHVNRLAMAKARQGYRQLAAENPGLVVLAADTVVEIGGQVLGKPADSRQAAAFLARLSGNRHRVHTAVAVVTGDNESAAISSSEVEFAELTDAQISAYVATGEPLDKAGAYAIQGIAAQFITQLSGSYSGVMGLPLYETASLLSACGVRSGI